MSVQVMVGTRSFTIVGADHLSVQGDLVLIQRSGPSGYDTVAVAGEGLLVTVGPAPSVQAAAIPRPEAGRQEPGRSPAADGRQRLARAAWHPVGDPMPPAD